MGERYAGVHPIVAQLTPSEEQLPAVRASEESVVVTAGAGAGKTRTLVARYLYLLADQGLRPRQIAAITFTRKAARQMRNDIREAIGRYLGQPLPAEPQRRWDQLYGELDAARIGTIHQLCTEILRAHPAEAQVDPRFEVLDEAQGALLQAEAVERGLAWAAEHSEGVALFELLGERRLREVGERLLRERLKARAAFKASPEEMLARWEEALAAEQARALQALCQGREWKQCVQTLRRAEPARADDRMAQQQALALGALDALDVAAGPVEQRRALAVLEGINLSGGSQKAWPGGKEELQAVKDALRGLRRLWQAQGDVQVLALTEVDQQVAAALPAMHGLFRRAAEAYRRLKEERQALDFDDLEARALALLQAEGAVRRRWQRELAAILVDEYQDTNGRQRDLVNLLHGEGHGLFIVGDAKQSIYRFRGAEVAVFREERARIAAQEGDGGRGYHLAKSYRPHKKLLEGLNTVLEAVMGTEADPARPWQEPFTPLVHHRDAPAAGMEPPYISVQLGVGNKETGLSVAATALAAEIAAMVADGGGAVRYEHVAILCRASTSFGYYEDVLDEWGIPYLTVAGRGFYERPEIRDLLNALRVLLDPGDDLALAGVLRSPVGGYRDGDLYALSRAREANGAPSLWAQLTGEDETAPLLPLLRALHTQAGREPVADLLKSFLDGSGYRAALRRAGQQRALRNVEKLLALAHESRLVEVSEFLAYIDKVRTASSREGEARATAGNAVQIMSVHQAKGLEFPVVVIGDLNRGGGGRIDFLIREDWGLLPQVKDEAENEPVAFLLGKREEEAQEEAESRRLLYVAATRARDRLILNGNVTIKKNGEPSGRGWLKELLGPLGLEGETVEANEDGDRALARQLWAGDLAVACTFYEPNYRPPRPEGNRQSRAARRRQWTAPLLAPLAVGTDEAAAEETERRARRVWRVVPEASGTRSAPSWLVGSLVHEALAAWRFPAGEGDRPFVAWAEARAREYGLTDAGQIKDAGRRTARLLRRFHGHALFQEMDGARRLHELPYAMDGGEGLALGQIDILYRRNGQWHVVDFKTDKIVGAEGLARLLRETEYVAQVQRYGQAVERLLGEMPACAICFLDYENGVHVKTVPE